MIGDIIRQRRIELGLTQEQLAQKLGYKGKSAINKIELNINDVNQKTLKKFADALDVPLSYFIEGFNVDVERMPHNESVLMAYAKKLSELSPNSQENALKYIDFLSERDSK
mgnify:CR=1 FL=1